eukprot:TRINITY_DN1827_c0_g1_i1.p1 TRINITY_DN1827_c0_g1~~TRINITY_DN1827_c0_g1_i1.p1  ORF type:complete len:291 (-),score=48.65 TRINITY_DN1827_c0_g1_i1:9-881(-)
MGVCCTNNSSGRDDSKEEIRLGPKSNRHNMPADVRKQELEFNDMIARVVINFPWIAQERAKMGPYDFLVDPPPQSLDLVHQKILHYEYYGFLSKDIDKPEYKGLMIFDDGCVYEGEFANGKIYKGRKFIEKKSAYVGEFKNQLPDGKGTATDSLGNVFTGQWVNGKLNGEGAEKNADGSSYTGGYIDGERDGEGIFIARDTSRYEGSFKKGAAEGKGTFSAADGSIKSGTWRDGRLSGHGSIKEKCGREYLGEFVKGKREGLGTECYNGGIKQGLWKKDKFIEERGKSNA